MALCLTPDNIDDRKQVSKLFKTLKGLADGDKVGLFNLAEGLGNGSKARKVDMFYRCKISERIWWFECPFCSHLLEAQFKELA